MVVRHFLPDGNGVAAQREPVLDELPVRLARAGGGGQWRR